MERTGGDVHPNYQFVDRNGNKIKNLKELHDSVENMDDLTFNHHVNDFHNDFHNWVRDVHKDNKLASELLNAKSKKEMGIALKNRLDELRLDISESKVAEASLEVAKREPKKTKKRAKKATKTKIIKEVKPKQVEAEKPKPAVHAVHHKPVTADIPTKNETTDYHPMHRTKRAIGDFALGLIIGGVLGIIISKFIV